MQINISITNESNPGQTSRVLRNLAAALEGVEIVPNPILTGGFTEPEPAPTEEKPKTTRGRSSKATDAPKDTRTNEEAAQDLSASIAAADAKTNEAETPADSTPVKLEDIVGKAKELVVAGKRDAVNALLSSFGAASFGELKDEDFGPMFTGLQNIV